MSGLGSTNSLIITALFVILVLFVVRKRDFYVVIREFRIIRPDEYGKAKQIEKFFVEHFDDYLAAKASFDSNEILGANALYEDQQQINYVYAVPAFTAKSASRKMAKESLRFKAKLLIETPFSSLQTLKKHWDAERKMQAENQKWTGE